AWYHCDHLGTPMELTDEQGNVAWTGQYKAWGEVREERSAWAKQQGLGNPLRFQGQYHDHETGLHYNRYRYYDPNSGRFICKDPISYSGGINLFEYTINPILWIDPLGLAKNKYKVRRPPADAHDPHGSKAPGKPGEAEGFCECKLGETWVKLDDGRGSGWVDKHDDVWVPTGPEGPGSKAHGGAHWDVQKPKGEYENVYPGGKRR
ncbi:RHS repeat domain-containing protein, partial [Pseudomonas sp. ES1]|uniref:RHS repeat domain-containing protein n=1 Tax=Pseudomonas sp. ES1 TaxID=3424775 RepID=UPI003D34C047